MGVGSALTRMLDHIARRSGSLTFSQYSLLGSLREAHPSPLEPWQLGRAVSAGSAQVTALLDGLERGGLVRREPHPSDRRRRLVLLTPEGKARVEQVAAHIHRAETQLLSQVTADGLQREAEVLKTAITAVVDSDPSFGLTAEPGHLPSGG